MTNVNISPADIPPLDEHTMGHILSEMADQTRDDGPQDRAGWTEILLGVGYPPSHVHQILDRWFVRCTTCGKDATHLWAGVGEDGSISSMCGNGKFSPSCDDCTGEPAGEIPQTGVLRAPLDFDPTRVTLTFGDHPGAVADWLCNRQEDTLAEIVTKIDQGDARGMLAIAIRRFAQSVAMQSQNEIHQLYFDEVLLDLLIDARGA